MLNIDNAEDQNYNNKESGGVLYADSNRVDRGVSERSTGLRGTGIQMQKSRGNGRGHQGLPRRSVSEDLSRAFMEDLEKLPLYDGEDGYDNAKSYRDSLIEDRRKFSKKDKKNATRKGDVKTKIPRGQRLLRCLGAPQRREALVWRRSQ